MNVYGNKREHKYQISYGEYEYFDAVIPFVFEGFLLNSKDENEPFRVVTAVNNSVPYEEVPFYFESSSWVTFCKRGYFASNVKGLFDSSDLTEACGITLYLNFISPMIEFTDKAKTKILADRFSDKLIGVLSYLASDAVKEIQRAKKARKAFNRSMAMYRVPKISKKGLMNQHFAKALEKASGGYLVTARQIFYVLREIINQQYGEELTKSDYNTFTQSILTAIFKGSPEIEERVLLERRGVFRDPFSGKELPLGTLDVNRYINSKILNRIYTKTEKIYSVPLNYRFNHVLFIEKGGYNNILEQSGFTAKKNLAVMATQGFGTRAAKNLIAHFIEQGIKVYILHDCDLPGYLIHKRIRHGSSTFKDKLDVVRIGLTVQDIDELGIRSRAETISYNRSYSDSLDMLSREERSFFTVNPNTFRRIEINALTTPELLAYLDKKIECKPIRPSLEELAMYMEIDPKKIIMEALYRVLGDRIDFEVDKKMLAEIVLGEISNGEHWVKTMDSVVAKWTEEKTALLAGHLKEVFE